MIISARTLLKNSLFYKAERKRSHLQTRLKKTTYVVLDTLRAESIFKVFFTVVPLIFEQDNLELSIIVPGG